MVILMKPGNIGQILTRENSVDVRKYIEDHIPEIVGPARTFLQNCGVFGDKKYHFGLPAMSVGVTLKYVFLEEVRPSLFKASDEPREEGFTLRFSSVGDKKGLLGYHYQVERK